MYYVNYLYPTQLPSSDCECHDWDVWTNSFGACFDQSGPDTSSFFAVASEKAGNFYFSLCLLFSSLFHYSLTSL